MFRISSRLAAALCAGTVAALAGVTAASAHVVQQFGSYSIAIGWLHEPTYVGVENAVQVIVKDAKDNPVNDLNPGDLKVTVSTGGVSSKSLDLEPSFDPDTGLGTPGEYDASLIPTAPGTYTFHLTGSIHGTSVDKSFTSSDKTFDDVHDAGAAGVEFPTTVPPAAALSTRIARADARAASAQDGANRAMVLAIVALAIGVVLGGAGTALAMRRRTV